MSCLEIMTENIATESESGNGGHQVIRAFGQEAQVLVSSQATGDAFCILRISASPGNVTPPHVHRGTDETFLIESGEVEVDLGGKLLRGTTPATSVWPSPAVLLPLRTPFSARVPSAA
jgi:mannose-6-phosphate isomerase-like protein (cupin superfamily)